MNITEKISELIRSIIDVQEEIKVDSNLLDEGIIDSLGVVTLITLIEETYKIKIEDSDFDIENFKNINTIASMVEHIINRKGV